MLRTESKLNEGIEYLATEVVDAAYSVHKTLGPGLLESVYEKCMCHELSKRDVCTRTQVSLPVIYDGVSIDAGLRIDMYVDEQVIIELKSVEKVLPVHKAQLLTYMKLANAKLGFLINFNVPLLKNGISRMVL